jgi:hypothetical protein
MEKQEPLKLQMRGFDSHSAHQTTCIGNTNEKRKEKRNA